MNRRRFATMLAAGGGFAFASRALGMSNLLSSLSADGDAPVEMARFPQKTDLILLTDRPPQLETPLKYFATDLTPNEAFFVRWHLADIPTSIDTQSFRLEVNGKVKKPLSLSLDDLRTKFEPVSTVAVCRCAGNARGLFEPRVPGSQWKFGAMGNARWKGVRLKDLLESAGVMDGAVQVGLRGLDNAPWPQTPRFEKSLQIDRARDGETIVAYEMNGEPLPMLNGFPVRLVVPGWFATYWVKSLKEISVLDQPLKTFWMDTAYRIPDNPRAEEDPQHQAATTVPINRMPVHSIFVRPGTEEKLHAKREYTLEGIAHDGGSGIQKVEVSTDQGKTWGDAVLGNDLGKYSWRRWRMKWKPPARGNYQLRVRAVANDGQQQVLSQWNRSGYQRDVVEQTEVVVL